jgi:DNA-binding response OmpR family regulator
MPGMNGAEFVRELRRTHPELPVMVISGLDEAEYEYVGMNVRFLVKPLLPDLLLSNLSELLQQEQVGVA